MWLPNDGHIDHDIFNFWILKNVHRLPKLIIKNIYIQKEKETFKTCVGRIAHRAECLLFLGHLLTARQKL